MGDTLLGIAITVILFTLIRIAEVKGSEADLTDEEREWLRRGK